MTWENGTTTFSKTAQYTDIDAAIKSASEKYSSQHKPKSVEQFTAFMEAQPAGEYKINFPFVVYDLVKAQPDKYRVVRHEGFAAYIEKR